MSFWSKKKSDKRWAVDDLPDEVKAQFMVRALNVVTELRACVSLLDSTQRDAVGKDLADLGMSVVNKVTLAMATGADMAEIPSKLREVVKHSPFILRLVNSVSEIFKEE